MMRTFHFSELSQHEEFCNNVGFPGEKKLLKLKTETSKILLHLEPSKLGCQTILLTK